ncbi:MAG: SpoIID/LytB domain-containing protein [Mediterranea sp.]|jgi:SpoIID/LytB domain protein|nr:SpoIID/LytB domain-containing protein [Mediterranea sp.]
MTEPTLSIGILSGKEIEFSFPVAFITSDGQTAWGAQKAWYQDGCIRWQGRTYDRLSFTPPVGADSFFELKGVTIGIRFHWERQEAQRFKGVLSLMVVGEELVAVNLLPMEAYLTSVVSSEMNADAPPAFLRAHAVIARSWAMDKLAHPTEHKHFTLCADDHCQRYQGIGRTTSPQAVEAVAATRGEVLTYGGEICDTRYSKCCGGAMEEFGSCWDGAAHPYLQGKRDSSTAASLPDLTREEEAERWIRSTPDAFCHTQDKALLAQVLNSYDRETPDFYRWKVTYTQEELASLIRQRLGDGFGPILDLVPRQRGVSGRIIYLDIVGTYRTLTIGKELNIRRALSPTHLYSSAFVVDKEGTGPAPSRFILTGAGWGHGVGLCQIGAAVMGSQGYSYRDILSHYYPGSELTRSYT